MSVDSGRGGVVIFRANVVFTSADVVSAFANVVCASAGVVLVFFICCGVVRSVVGGSGGGQTRLGGQGLVGPLKRWEVPLFKEVNAVVVCNPTSDNAKSLIMLKLFILKIYVTD